MNEQKVRDAASVAREIAIKSPEHSYVGVFSQVFHALVSDPNTQEKPLLGLATTRELLAEISARIEMGGGIGRGLDYRTVDSD